MTNFLLRFSYLKTILARETKSGMVDKVCIQHGKLYKILNTFKYDNLQINTHVYCYGPAMVASPLNFVSCSVFKFTGTNHKCAGL